MFVRHCSLFDSQAGRKAASICKMCTFRNELLEICFKARGCSFLLFSPQIMFQNAGLILSKKEKKKKKNMFQNEFLLETSMPKTVQILATCIMLPSVKSQSASRSAGGPVDPRSLLTADLEGLALPPISLLLEVTQMLAEWLL